MAMEADSKSVRLFCCGDVMTGRGIDQILARPSDPQLYEPYVRDARDYVKLAERENGAIPAPVPPDYIWGDALAELEEQAPALRLINLETAVTTHDEPWPDKGIHYRMHPGNIDCLTVAGIHCCNLANNHVLDWCQPGLLETVEVLDGHGLGPVGAGADSAAAAAPWSRQLPGGGRLLVLGLGLHDSGIPLSWGAGRERPGVQLASRATAAAVEPLAERIREEKGPDDHVIVSVHWGGNWGFRVPEGHREVAHALIDAGADLIHGHSCHHARPLEIYRGKAVFYGCGDFINDYEGIGGHEDYRPDLRLMFFPELDAGDGTLKALRIRVLRSVGLRLQRAEKEDARWIADRLNEFAPADTPRLTLADSGELVLSPEH